MGQPTHSQHVSGHDTKHGHGAFVRSISQLCLKHASNHRSKVMSKWKVNKPHPAFSGFSRPRLQSCPCVSPHPLIPLSSEVHHGDRRSTMAVVCDGATILEEEEGGTWFLWLRVCLTLRGVVWFELVFVCDVSSCQCDKASSYSSSDVCMVNVLSCWQSSVVNILLLVSNTVQFYTVSVACLDWYGDYHHLNYRFINVQNYWNYFRLMNSFRYFYNCHFLIFHWKFCWNGCVYILIHIASYWISRNEVPGKS